MVGTSRSQIDNPHSKYKPLMLLSFLITPHIAELASTAKVTAKSDVYSFGVIVLQVLVGKHPKELISNLRSGGHNQLFADILDKRLAPPTGPLLQELVLAATIAMLCINENPISRPTMDQVSREMSASARVPPPTRLQTLTLKDLMASNHERGRTGLVSG